MFNYSAEQFVVKLCVCVCLVAHQLNTLRCILEKKNILHIHKEIVQHY